MAGKAQQQGAQAARRLQTKLKQRLALAESQKGASVVVGYSAAYAVHVHENTEMKLVGVPRPGKKGKPGLGKYWDAGRGKQGQNKFLEAPARVLRGELAKIVKEHVMKTGNLIQGLFIAGLRLQRESQELVPVHYGNLRASAFTEKETPG